MSGVWLRDLGHVPPVVKHSATWLSIQNESLGTVASFFQSPVMSMRVIQNMGEMVINMRMPVIENIQ
jgi:hypothetical protein